MTKINIHNSKKRIEYAKATIQKRFSEDNAKTACRFLAEPIDFIAFDGLFNENK